MLAERDKRHVERRIKQLRAGQNTLRNGVIPARGHTFDDGETFDGLPPDTIEYRGLTSDELGDNQVDGRVLKTTGDAATERAVPNAAIRSDAVDERTIGPQALRFGHFPIRNVLGGAGNVNALPIDVKADANNIRGELNLSNVPVLGPDKVPGLGGLNGRLSPSQAPDLNQLGGKVNAHNQIDYGSSGHPPIPPSAVKPGYNYHKLSNTPKLSSYVKRSELKSTAFK